MQKIVWNRAKCLQVSNFLSTFADENRIWEMAHGYSQVHGDSIIAIDHICRNERTHHSVYGGPTLSLCPMSWTILGKWRKERRKSKNKEKMNTLIVSGLILLIAIVVSIFFKYQDHKMAKQE